MQHGTGATTDYSKTNVQVEGVDEADIVKTDGQYIYYVNGSKIVIVNASDSKDLKIASEIKYSYTSGDTFSPSEVYVYNNKLIVIGTKDVYYDSTSEIFNNGYDPDIISSRYDYSSKQFTVAMIYDLADKTKATLEREIGIQGYYLSSRMVGENIYLLSNQYIQTYLYYGNEIKDIDENDFKPLYQDTAVSKEVQTVEFNDICYFPDSEEQNYLNIAGFSVNNNDAANIDSYLGAGETIYSSANNLYVTRTVYDYNDNYYSLSSSKVDTYIYKFKLEGTKTTYETAGSVPGTLLNQFSMDEYDGYFRIATTDYRNGSNINNLYVLDKDLTVVGTLLGLARGETIYSVRFMGKRAYIVTYVQVDPLFVIDLSDPEDPTVLGELKIPGYSDYLHPYDETHIIGFGKDTTTTTTQYGTRTTTNGMKMALFDVTDPSNPKELYQVKIGDSGTYSELLDNHKALLFSKEKNIIAFPITISKDVDDYQNDLTFQGAIIYGLDLTKGFTLKGKIAHMEITDGYEDYDYTKEVERIIYIDDTLFTLSKRLIKSTNMNTMKALDSLEITVEDSYSPYYYNGGIEPQILF